MQVLLNTSSPVIIIALTLLVALIVLISKISGITLAMIESTYYSKDWTIKYEEDLDRSINRAIAQNDYYCYI